MSSRRNQATVITLSPVAGVVTPEPPTMPPCKRCILWKWTWTSIETPSLGEDVVNGLGRGAEVSAVEATPMKHE